MIELIELIELIALIEGRVTVETTYKLRRVNPRPA